MQRFARIRPVAVAALAIAAAAITVWAWPTNVGTVREGEQSGTAQIGGPFELIDHTGRTVTEQTWRGQYLLIYFGYSFCPDVCPLELDKISRALDRLDESAPSVLDRLQPLFITVDPQRDTVERMAEYVDHFHPSLVGLTGNADQIKTAAAAYRVYFQKSGDTDGDDYLMDHSSVIYLMDGQNSYVGHFTIDDDAQTIAETIRQRIGQDIG